MLQHGKIAQHRDMQQLMTCWLTNVGCLHRWLTANFLNALSIARGDQAGNGQRWRFTFQMPKCRGLQVCDLRIFSCHW
jgi:hypothetical protein